MRENLIAPPTTGYRFSNPADLSKLIAARTVEPALNQVHDVGERFSGVAALRHQTADFFERPEDRPVLTRHR